jgi:membrane-associated phospholipid phosphatase
MMGIACRHIPFVKVFVLPYLFWFVYIVGALIYLGLKSRKDFLGLCAFMFIGMSICMVIYYFFPNGQRLRPIIMDTDFFSRLIKTIYKNDTPTNVAPSIHVLNSIAVHVALVRYEPFGGKRILKWSSFAVMISIILSTVFIKQHAVMDVLWGLVLSCAMYYLVYRVLLSDKVYTASKRVANENAGSRHNG